MEIKSSFKNWSDLMDFVKLEAKEQLIKQIKKKEVKSNDDKGTN
ncbi:MAG: hypothetical protein WC393_01235 [Candidatus Nanoarchaeia archaeon]|jgi:hypothetical protein